MKSFAAVLPAAKNHADRYDSPQQSTMRKFIEICSIADPIVILSEVGFARQRETNAVEGPHRRVIELRMPQGILIEMCVENALRRLCHSIQT